MEPYASGPGAGAGAAVRRIRTAAGLSLSALATVSGVGKGTLSELESGTRNPTLATLYALARPLGVPLAALLDEHPTASVSGDGLTATLLHVRRADGGTRETYLLDLEAGASRESAPHAPGVRESLLLTEGQALVGPAGTPVALEAGEATHWAADVPHLYAAESPASGLLSIWTPA